MLLNAQFLWLWFLAAGAGSREAAPPGLLWFSAGLHCWLHGPWPDPAWLVSRCPCVATDRLAKQQH